MWNPVPSRAEHGLLFLVRHGQSTWNAEGKLQGQADPPLTPEGENQAAAMGKLLAGVQFHRAVCSDLQRARRTALLMGYDRIHLDPRWREIDVGAWSGRSVDVLQAEDQDVWRSWWAGRSSPPGGEAWDMFHARVAEALAGFPREGATLVVTHGAVIRVTLSLLLGSALDGLAPPPSGSLTLIETGSGPRLRAYGATSDTLEVPRL